MSAWIDAQPAAWREAVAFVAIDMCTIFKAAVRASLPNATLAVDRFHVAQLANSALTHTNPDRTVIAGLLFRFYTACAESGLIEMECLATTVETWWPQIEAAIRTGVNNAGSEGTNRVIKADARAAFGYRNPANQRLRARCTTTRRSRGHLSTRTSGRHGQLR